MMRSPMTDPMSWWPVGIVTGYIIGAAINRYERHRAAADTPDSADVAADGAPGLGTGVTGDRRAPRSTRRRRPLQ